tara:strand:+ start:1625 stop:2854 length:1230 start_codon:yes stop_codon:yes gene_type:complete
MAISKTIPYTGENTDIKISGTPGSEFELYVLQGSSYYNFDTNSFSATVKILKNEKIPSNGVYIKTVVIPQVIADAKYDFFVRPIGSTKSNLQNTNEQKIGTIYQKGTKTMTFTTTSAASLVIASGLTGGTATQVDGRVSQAGTITKSGSPLIYVHSTPTWNKQDGGNWTFSNEVKTTVTNVNGAVVTVEDGSDIASGYAVVGENIVDEITVSAISGNKITLSTAQRLTDGQELVFSKAEWGVKTIYAKLKNSGTTAVTMSMVAEVSKVGIANLTSACAVDGFVSVKPNAFPVNATCSAGGEVEINIVRECTNYQGGRGDIDVNQADKTYAIFSIPADATSSRPTDGEFGGISLDANEAMGSAGAGVVTYNAHANMVAGDTDFFFYDCIDDQSTPVASATDQGKISITIV